MKTLNLCAVPVCGTLELNKAAVEESPFDLIYKLIVDYLGTQITISQAQTEGENIQFNISDLNENFEYTGQVFDSAGNLVSFDSGEETYDCIKFTTIQSINAAGPAPAGNSDETVIIEGFIDGEMSITGTEADVLGLEDGSFEVTSIAFVGKRLFIQRGALTIPPIDPGDNSGFYTKALGSDTIVFSDALEAGEYLRIETIP